MTLQIGQDLLQNANACESYKGPVPACYTQQKKTMHLPVRLS